MRGADSREIGCSKVLQWSCSVTWWERRLLPAADWCADCTRLGCTACSSPGCSLNTVPRRFYVHRGEADGRLDCNSVCSTTGGAAVARLQPAEKSRLAESGPAAALQSRSTLHCRARRGSHLSSLDCNVKASGDCSGV